MINPLAHRASMHPVSAGNDPNHQFVTNDLKDVENFDFDLAVRLFLRIYGGNPASSGVSLTIRAMRDANYQGDSFRPESKKASANAYEWNLQTCPSRTNPPNNAAPSLLMPNRPRLIMKPKIAGETAALGWPERGGVNLHHARRSKCLHVTVDSANHDEQPEKSPK